MQSGNVDKAEFVRIKSDSNQERGVTNKAGRHEMMVLLVNCKPQILQCVRAQSPNSRLTHHFYFDHLKASMS